MALVEKQKKRYLSIVEGTLRERVTIPQSNSTSRSLESGVIIHEVTYKAVEGVIKKMFLKHHDKYGTSLSIDLFDEVTSETYCVSLSENSRYFTDFLCRLPNMEWEKPVEFAPYRIEDAKGTKLGLVVRQDGNKLAHYYKVTKCIGPNKYESSFLHDYPEYTGPSGNTNKFKAYLLEVVEFLKSEMFNYTPVSVLKPDASSVQL